MKTKTTPIPVLTVIASLTFAVSNADATLVQYGPSRYADVQAGYSVDGSGYLTSATLVIGSAQSLQYGTSRSVNILGNSAVTFENGWLHHGQISGNQTVVAGTSAEYGSYNVNLKANSVTTFTDEYFSSGTLNGDQWFPYFLTESVQMKDSTGVILTSGIINAGILAANQSLYCTWTLQVDFKASTQVTFNLDTMHAVRAGTLNGDQSLQYFGGNYGWATFKNNTVIYYDDLSAYVEQGVLSGAQSLYYYFNSGTQTGRQVSLKDNTVVTADAINSAWITSGTSNASQTLTTSGGPVGVSDWQFLTFAGGYYTP